MTNKKTTKSQLAKLMATENLTIVHKKVPTAYFDMKNRILCCPIFKEDLSSELYDLFMGHEVGHALNTPWEGVHSALTKNRTLKGYLNVVEDVRIERKIRETYPGLRKSFYKAYNELMQMDFFGIKEKDLNKDISLIDKINLITKVGSRVNISLSKEEKFFLDWSMKCETWEEVEECATAIYDWSKENETRTELDESIVPQTLDIADFEDEDGEEDEYGDDDGGFGEDESDDYGDDDGYGEGDDDEEDNLPDNITSPSGDPSDEDEEGEESSESSEGEGEESEDETRKTTGGNNREGGQGSADEYDDENGARESITEHNAHNNEDQFISEDNTITTTIHLKDKFKDNKNFKGLVVGYKDVSKDFDYFYEPKNSDYFKDNLPTWKRKAEITSKNLRDKNKKIVSHMAKEFEMKQTAMRSAKAFQGKTGKLDMNRLAKYQIVDDVFKKVTYLPDGKNHGLQVLLDWSGSIHNECSDLIEQSMVLVDFCRKVQIPHRVYLFTDSYRTQERIEEEGSSYGSSTRLIEIFSDKQSSKEFIKAHQHFAHLWNCHAFNGNYRNLQKLIEQHNTWFGTDLEVDDSYSSYWEISDFREPGGYRLGGTPLDHCLTAMRVMVPEFNREYSIEKSILTVITDGFSHRSDIFSQSPSEHEEKREQESDDEYSWRTPTKRVLIDPFTNKSHAYYDSECGGHYSFDQTQNILEWISSETGVIVTGYFVLGRKQDLWEMASHLPSMDIDVSWRQIRKEGVAVQVKGYNKLFLTSSHALSVSGDSELDDELVGATKRKLLGAFKKNQSSKTTSRFLTNEFIKEIA